MRKSLVFIALSVLCVAAPGAAEDKRQLVQMPEMMQRHMLANMRDHLRALDEVLAALAEGRSDDASWVAEQRLGMSSLEKHGASHMAPHMPEGMRAIGTGLHRAASRFAGIVQVSGLTQDEDQRAVFAALRDITAQCNACHAAYRIH